MADFILKRRISGDTYHFPAGAFKIYGNGKFYNGFSIGATSGLSVINEDGVLKFSREAAAAQEQTSVILGAVPANSNTSVYVDVAAPISPSSKVIEGLRIGTANLYIDTWSNAKIYQTTGDGDAAHVQAGGEMTIYFQWMESLPAIPDLCSLRAIWLK